MSDKYKDTDTIARAHWSYEDLKNIIEDAGYEPTDENIEKVLSRSELHTRLEEQAYEEGLNIMRELVDTSNLDE